MEGESFIGLHNIPHLRSSLTPSLSMALQEAPANSIILYPSPGMGHVVSMVELAKLLITHHFSVTIIIVNPHYNTGATVAFIADVSASHPAITFHRLPSIDPPLSSSHRIDVLLRLSNPLLRSYLISLPAPPSAAIIDTFCSYALDVTSEFHIPCFFFYTSGANALAVHLHLPVLHELSPLSFREQGTSMLSIPGTPPLPANHMTQPMLDRYDDIYRVFLNHYRRFNDASGIIINTFTDLEPRALAAVAEKAPPLYCIGPLVKGDEKINGNTNTEECITWLDMQPKKSVMYLCFGSMGVFSAEQLKLIAVGLEKSGQRFLWAVRSPRSDDPANMFEKPAEPELEKLLPLGFLERTKERGMVVKSWAPQMAVLGHEAVGGFVSHCGWNSVLEAVTNGVAMIAWPLYAEQWMNKVFLVEEMKLAVAVKGYDEAVVTAEEVEAKVRWLMETEEGDELKKRAAAAKEAAEKAFGEGGTSAVALREFVGLLRR